MFLFALQHECWITQYMPRRTVHITEYKFNSIFGKIGQVAPENVVVDRLKCKCLPLLLYSLEACRLNKAQIKSLNFVVFGAFGKIFNTRSSDIVTHCMQIFDCDNIESILLKRRTKLMRKFTEGIFGDVFG